MLYKCLCSTVYNSILRGAYLSGYSLMLYQYVHTFLARRSKCATTSPRKLKFGFVLLSTQCTAIRDVQMSKRFQKNKPFQPQKCTNPLANALCASFIQGNFLSFLPWHLQTFWCEWQSASFIYDITSRMENRVQTDVISLNPVKALLPVGIDD